MKLRLNIDYASGRTALLDSIDVGDLLKAGELLISLAEAEIRGGRGIGYKGVNYEIDRLDLTVEP